MIGAPRPLQLEKPAVVDTAQAARYFGARGTPDDATMRRAVAGGGDATGRLAGS